jgi:hypothetical protein
MSGTFTDFLRRGRIFRRANLIPLILGFLILAVAQLAPYVGPGKRDSFVVYKMIGLERRQTAYLAILFILAGALADPLRAIGENVSTKLKEAALAMHAWGLGGTKRIDATFLRNC